MPERARSYFPGAPRSAHFVVPIRSEERFMHVRLRSTLSARRLAAAVSLTIVATGPVAAQAPAALPPAKDLIAKFVTATNAGPVMAKHQSVRTKGRFEMAAAGVSGDLEISQARPNKTMMRI